MSIDYGNPQKYIGEFQKCCMGYSNEKSVREGAASGGVVTTLLYKMFENGKIDGAFVSRQEMIDGKVSARSFIATSKEDILNSSTSIYVDFPLGKYFEELLKFEGRVAVVALPCEHFALTKYIEKHPELNEKIALKICLFCSGSPTQSLMQKILKKNKINADEVERFYFRRGHWRGKSFAKMKDGSEKGFSYLYNIGNYKNLYYEMLPRCLACSNHFGYDADLSCGDVWLKEMKSEPIKHTGVVLKTERGQKLFDEVVSEGAIIIKDISPEKVLKSQKRALNFKFSTASARRKLGGLFGIQYVGNVTEKSKWNHYLVAFLILLNVKASRNKTMSKLIFLIPRRLLFIYMGFVRLLLNK